jgi:hypothetical protein
MVPLTGLEPVTPALRKALPHRNKMIIYNILGRKKPSQTANPKPYPNWQDIQASRLAGESALAQSNPEI